jgi:hypothetical protein
MKLVLSAALATATLALALPASVAVAQDAHTIVAPDQIKWGPAPDVLPPGAEAALLEELGVEIETKKGSEPDASPGADHRGLRGDSAFCRAARPSPAAWRGRGIFERLYAVRLDRLRQLADCRALLEPLDHQGLLTSAGPGSVSAPEELDDDELLASSGLILRPPTTSRSFAMSGRQRRSAQPRRSPTGRSVKISRSSSRSLRR